MKVDFLFDSGILKVAHKLANGNRSIPALFILSSSILSCLILFCMRVYVVFNYQQEHKVLLTGTPLQNSVEELFSLLNFLEPVQFSSETTFLEEFGDLKTDEQVSQDDTEEKPNGCNTCLCCVRSLWLVNLCSVCCDLQQTLITSTKLLLLAEALL